MSTTQPSIPEMMARVQAKASQDAAFRAAFLKDPRATIEAEFNLTLPEQAKVRAVEAPADTVVVLLPAAQAADGALSDGELEAVAGGGKAEAAAALRSISYNFHPAFCR